MAAQFPDVAAYVRHRLKRNPSLTQEQLAADMALTPSALSLYIAHKRAPKPATALRLSRRYRIQLAGLLRTA